MRVLITGTAGFIGFHLANQLASRGHELYGIDNLNDYYDPELKANRLIEAGFDINALTGSAGKITSSKYTSYSFKKLSLEDKIKIKEVFD